MKDGTSASSIELPAAAAAAADAAAAAENLPIGENVTITDGNAKYSTTSTIAAGATTTPVTRAIAANEKTLLLQSLGRNARERLQKVRSKRRVIQRIGVDDHTDPQSSGGNKSTATPAPTTTTTKVRRPMTRQQQKSNNNQGDDNENSTLIESDVNVQKRTVAISTRRKSATIHVHQRRQKRRSNHPNDTYEDDSGIWIDRWVPDTSHIHNHTDQKAIRVEDSAMSSVPSNTVQLHGLPIHTTMQQIRSFFTGLHIQRIVMLLPYPTNIVNGETFRLIDFDATYVDRTTTRSRNSNNNNNFLMERYDSNMVRLFVQFPTDAIATLAEQRSGEVIYTMQQRTQNRSRQPQDDEEEQEKEEPVQCGAAIAVTIVPHAMALLMTKLLGIDMTEHYHHNSTTIEEIIEPIVQNIDPQISMTLWETVMDELSLHVNLPLLTRTTKQSYRSCLRVATSDQEMQELQHEQLQLQQEIDRIIHVSSSSVKRCISSSSSSGGSNSDVGECNDHWSRILLFLMSTNTKAATNRADHDPNQLFACLFDTVLQHGSSHHHPIISLTREYIQQLQSYIQRIDTIRTITHRKAILFGTNVT